MAAIRPGTARRRLVFGQGGAIGSEDRERSAVEAVRERRWS